MAALGTATHDPSDPEAFPIAPGWEDILKFALHPTEAAKNQWK
jgi:hypothetical protein